jgi:hypothetical protein
MGCRRDRWEKMDKPDATHTKHVPGSLMPSNASARIVNDVESSSNDLSKADEAAREGK